jgi:hypothetical protein
MCTGSAYVATIPAVQHVKNMRERFRRGLGVYVQHFKYVFAFGFIDAQVFAYEKLYIFPEAARHGEY